MKNLELRNNSMEALKRIKPIRIITLSAPLFVLALFLFRYSTQAQFGVLIVAAVVYLGTAVLHHRKDKTLTFEIIIEYVLIAALALLMIQSFLS